MYVHTSIVRIEHIIIMLIATLYRWGHIIHTVVSSCTYVCIVALLKCYRIAGKFGGGKVWHIDSVRAFGERKFGELIDQPIDCLV